MLYICFAKLRLSMLYDRGNFALKFPRLFIISPTPPKKYLNSTFVVYHEGVPGGREHHRERSSPFSSQKSKRRYTSEPTVFTGRK